MDTDVWLMQWRFNAADPWRDLAMGTRHQMHIELERRGPRWARRNYRVVRRTITETVEKTP